MSQATPAIEFPDDRKGNTFFFQSPFRDWSFVAYSIQMALLLLSAVVVGLRYWNEASDASFFYPFILLVPGAIYPYVGALKRHRKIQKLYLSGQISASSPKSPLNQILEVADRSIKDAMLQSMLFVVLLFFSLVVRNIQHLK